MSSFYPTAGTNFSCPSELAAAPLSLALQKVAAFLQDHPPFPIVVAYHDWLEHDGLHFKAGTVDMHSVFESIQSPRAILESMTGDFNVFIAYAPRNVEWYLRFYLDWDDNDSDLLGRFDVTLEADLVAGFRKVVIPDLLFEPIETPAEQYFNSLTA